MEVMSQGSAPTGDRKCLDHDSDSDKSPGSTVSHDSNLMTGSDESYIIHRMSQFLCSETVICILLSARRRSPVQVLTGPDVE